MYGNDRGRHAPPTVEKRRSSRIVLVETSGKRVLQQSRLRLFLLSVVFALSFVIIGARTVEVAVLRGGISEQGQTLASYRATKVRHARTDITDRNGEIIATTLETASLYANPREIKRPVEVAEQLAKVLGDVPEKEMAKRLSADRSFVWIKRHLTPRQQKLVNDMGVPGLNFEPEFKRVYPHGNLFSHVLGYVDVDTHGIAGMEKALEEQLTDRSTARYPEPVALSLDLRVQSILREEMAATVKKFKAKGATGIVMDVRNGEVLGLSNLPDFDPHDPGGVDGKVRFNRATLGVYEMGSTFKTFSMAVALDAGTATMQSSYDATNPIKVARYTIRDFHPQKRWLTVPEIFAHSSNIGTVKMIMEVGTDRQREFMRKLGMLESIKMELPENAAPLEPSPWREINTMTISYGHGIAVTPMHLVRGIASIVGDGSLLPVTFLKSGNDGKPKGESVVQTSTTVNIRKLLRLVVETGTASKADVPGYRVGGKTGTAEKLSGEGGYNKSSKLVSFIGAFPADNPRYAVLVMVDEPQGIKETYGYATGGWVAAPAVGNVIGRIGPLLGVQPVFELEERRDAKPKQWVWNEQGGMHAISF